MWAPLSLAYRSFISSPLRGAVLLAAVLLGVASFSAVQLTNDAIGRGVEQSWYATVGRAHLYVRAFNAAGFPDAAVAAVRQQPSVRTVAPTARKWVFYRTTDRRGFIELIAVDPIAEPLVRSYRLDAGRFLSSDSRGVVVRSNWAAHHGLRVGDSFELITREGLRSFDVAGLLSDDAAGIASYGDVVLVPMNLGHESFGLENRVDTFAVVLASESSIPQAQQTLRDLLPGGLSVATAPQVRADLEQSVRELVTNLSLFGALALFVALFLILNTVEMMATSLMQQTGRLRAVGATRPQIFVYFLSSGLLPGAVGAVLGALAAYGLALGLGAWVGQVERVRIATIEFSPGITAVGIAAGLIAVSAAALSPAIRAARTNPLELVTAEGDAERGRASWALVVAGVILVVTSMLIIVGAPTTRTGRSFRILALLPLLIGLVFASRIAIWAMSHALEAIFQRTRGATNRLAAQNLTRHLTRTSLTVSGFGVSLSLMIALTAVAVGSAKTGERWTHALMPGAYAVVSPIDQPPIFVGRFTGIEGVTRASPVSFIQTLSRGAPIQLASVEPDVFAPGLDYVEGSAAEAARALSQGGAAIIPRTFSDERRLRIGDDLSVDTETGPELLRVVAVVANSFPSADGAGSVLISRGDGDSLFGNRSFRILNLQAGPGLTAAELRDAVTEMAERYGMKATTAREVSDQVAVALLRLLALFGALVGIAVIVAALGTANTMIMNIAEHARELSILWATGMSRRQLQGMAVTEAAMMGLMGGLLGAGLGAVLAWVLIALWSATDFQPEYNFPVEAAVIGIIVAIIASVLAAIAPARAASRLDVAL